jgi:hypothetical protein
MTGDLWSHGWLSKAPWRKSSFSSMGNCVEVAPDVTRAGVAVRNSRDPNGSVLLFTGAEWTAFVLGVKNAEFDDLPGSATG